MKYAGFPSSSIWTRNTNIYGVVSQSTMSYAQTLYLFPQTTDQGSPHPPQTDRDVDVIKLGNMNTVRTLRDQLARVVRAGYADTGFPILSPDANGKSRMLGFIGANELEHALSTSSIHMHLGAHLWFAHALIWYLFFLGIVAEEADHPVLFHPDIERRFRLISSSSISSLVDDVEDPFNFNVYMDKVRRRSAAKLFLRHFCSSWPLHPGSTDYKSQLPVNTCTSIFRQTWGPIRCCDGLKWLL